MKKIIILIFAGLLSATQIQANVDSTYLVLGVIASSDKQQGVALLKDERAKRTFAVRVGQPLNSAKDSTLLAVSRKYVVVAIKGQTYRFAVGDRVDHTQIAYNSRMHGHSPELESSEGLVKISSAYKDHLVKEQLGTILMQAATVPFYKNDKLAGFTFWDIEEGSIFERLGIKNGDTITSINQNEINDVGSTIRLLNHLKLDAKEVNLTYLRAGMQKETRILID